MVHMERYLKDPAFKNMVDFLLYVMEENYLNWEDMFAAFHLAEELAEGQIMRPYFFKDFCDMFLRETPDEPDEA